MPGKPTSPVPAASAPTRISRTDAAQAPEEVERARPVRAPERTQALAPAAPSQRVEPGARSELLRSVAGRLRRGEITAAEAVSELIEDAVQRNLKELGSDPEGARLREALIAYVKDDPTLAARVRRLEAKRTDPE